MQDDPYWATYALQNFLENFWYLIVALFGAIVGSFLGVVVYRLPIKELTPPELLPKGYSLSSPPSHCPHPDCKHILTWWENVPILAFLYLRGRCHDCKRPIPWRDFAMEILTSAVFVAIFHIYNGRSLADWVNVFFLCLFAAVLIAAVFIDLDHFIVPEDLNKTGIVIGLLRDPVLLLVGFTLLRVALPAEWNVHWEGARVFADLQSRYLYFGWLPRGFAGAAVYGGVLFLVSWVGFVVYARQPNETFAGVARRFVSGAEPPPLPGETDDADAEPAESEPEDSSPPVRLRFSPGFVTLLSATFLFIVIGWWSLLAVALPLCAFVLLTRTEDEAPADALRRFFRADDLPYEYDAPAAPAPEPAPVPEESLITGANVHEMVWNRAVAPAANFAVAGGGALPVAAAPTAPAPLTFADAQADADQFAKEAETGAHGGMGLGDVKLAIAIGAILGPGQAILSLVFAAFLGALTGLAMKAIHRKQNLRFGLPFVPFMVAGAFVCLLFGENLVTWYTGLYAPAPQQGIVTSPNGPHYTPGGKIELPSDANLRRYKQTRSQGGTRP